MTFSIAICDDEKEQIKQLTAQVKGWAARSGHTCQIQAFDSAEAFLFSYGDNKAYDILLLDVEMKGISGIDLARKIRLDNSRAEIIFVTSHFEFIGEGYDVDALHYLVKPILTEKLENVLTKAAALLAIEPPCVVISCEGETMKLYESEILYVEAFLHYISIHTKDREYKIKESISSFEKKLTDTFYRSHRSYLVSLKHIVRISRTAVTLWENIELPLSRGKYDDLNRAFIAHN